MPACKRNHKLEDLKVLRRSPDLFNNVKIGQGFTAYNKTFFLPCNLNNLMNTPSTRGPEGPEALT